MKYNKVDNVVVYPYQDKTQRIDYKGRVIQIYAFGEDDLCFFVMKEDGNDDKEFFCLDKAIRYIDRVTKE